MSTKPVVSALVQESAQAGKFAVQLAKQRENEHANLERQRAATDAAGQTTLVSADKFQSGAKATDYEAEFKAKTEGLVTVAEFRRAREEASAKEADARRGTAARPLVSAASATSKPAVAEAKRKRAVMSFTESDEEGTGPSVAPRSVNPMAGAARGGGLGVGAAVSGAGVGQSAETAPVEHGTASSEAADCALAAPADGAPQAKRFKVTKDPLVDTGYLPDAERDRREAALRESLRLEWLAQQEAVKKEKIEVVYSWWDGTGHRRKIVVPKGATIGKFLEWVRQDLVKDFPALRAIGADSLLYVKEDVIVPQSLTFYDMIVSKARGKTGPLFLFGIYDDLRTAGDARVERDESHPGKIVERRWYEQNKHAFPASRWEIFDLEVFLAKQGHK